MSDRSRMIELSPLRPEHLPKIDIWFDDPPTRRWLGGKGWAETALRLADPDRGRHVLAAHFEGELIGMLDVECSIDGSASFALVVDPTRRRGGLATRMIQALIREQNFAGITRFWCGIEEGNLASENLARRCGFVPATTSSEAGFVDYEFVKKVDQHHGPEVAVL